MNQKNSTVVIRASAGTGKTFQLTNRYLRLVKDGVKPEHILAVTFTRMAAGEIFERVLLRLAKAAIDVAACDELAGYLEDQAFTRERCLNLLQELTSNLHRVRVETLDAYFSQLARSFSLEIGLPANWEILEQVQDQRLRWEALQQTMVDDSDRTVSRLVRILFQGEAKRNVGGLLYDTVDSLYSVLLETEAEAWKNFPNLHPLGKDQVREAIERLELEPVPEHKSIAGQKERNLEAARDQDWQLFVSKGIAAHILKGKSTYYGKELSDELVAAYQQVIEHARAVLINQLKQQTEATHEILCRFHRHYSELKRKNRGIRFDDVTQHLMQLGKTVAAGAQNFRLDTEISHLLLDEFQDTSLRQWQIIRPLAERIVSGSQTLFDAAWSSFFCVGDVKQAIYGWRGGRSEIFDAIEKQLEGIHGQKLDESHRSAPPVIETVNKVFHGIRNHFRLESVEEVVRQWSENFPRHHTALKDARGFVQLETAAVAEWHDDRIPPRVQQDATFEYAAKKVKQLNLRMPDRTVGILVRKNDSVARMIYELRKIGVKASEERGGNPLTDSAAVQIVLSLLRLSDYPDDQVAAYHVASSPIMQAEDFNSFGLDTNLDALAMRQLSRSIRRSLMNNGYGTMVSVWASQLVPHCNARDLRRLQQLVELAFRYEPLSGIRASEFLRFVESERIADPLISNVRVMTIHQSKGLEFDTVVLPELEVEIDDCSRSIVWDSADPTESIDRVCVYRKQEIQNVLPEEMRQMFAEAKNREAVESLCLLYVAMTRAAHALYMIIAPATKGNRSLPRTFAGLLQVALAPDADLDSEQILYAAGEENWCEMDSAKDPDTSNRLNLPASLASRSTESPVKFEFQSPSTLEGGNRIAAGQLLQFSNRDALQRGTVIHGLFEQVTWIDEVPGEKELLQVATQLGDGHGDPASLVKDFLRMLKSDSVTQVLSRDYYLQPDAMTVIDAIPDDFNSGLAKLVVHNERRFVTPDDSVMLSGTIDRLVLLFSGEHLMAADIVDFKTDKLDFANEKEYSNRVEHYRPQVDAYRRAVCSIYGLPPERISGRLVFVSGNIVSEFAPVAPPSPACNQ